MVVTNIELVVSEVVVAGAKVGRGGVGLMVDTAGADVLSTVSFAAQDITHS